MKTIIIFLFCLSFTCTHQAYAQHDAVAPATTGPQFKFKDGDTYDFGEVPSGPDVTHDFIFTNIGNEPLTVIDAKPSCSCTTPTWSKESILPGKTGIINVGFHTTKSGQFMKEVYIQSNAFIPSGDRRYTIYIKGTVK